MVNNNFHAEYVLFVKKRIPLLHTVAEKLVTTHTHLRQTRWFVACILCRSHDHCSESLEGKGDRCVHMGNLCNCSHLIFTGA